MASDNPKSRTSFYRMGILKYFKVVKEDTLIFVLMQEEWENFEKDADFKASLFELNSLILREDLLSRMNIV